ncbi:MAG: hypothetical protein V4617_07235 [Gemmatimonadota bacterium]
MKTTMPIQYTIDTECGVIEETWNGSITIRDLSEYWSRYLSDPDVLGLRRTVVDLREADIAFTGAQLEMLVQSMVIPALNGMAWTTAIVVSEPVQFGVGRQYQVFAQRYSRDSIFDDMGKAKAWLIEQRDH